MKKFIFEIDGFGYDYFDDYMEDNIKRFHELHVPGKERSEIIDFSPYGTMTEETFANIVEFYKKNGRAPDRFADVDNTSNVYCPMTDAEIAAAVHRPVRRETINPFRS